MEDKKPNDNIDVEINNKIKHNSSVTNNEKSGLPQKSDRPYCGTAALRQDEQQFLFDQSQLQYSQQQGVIDNDSYDIEDEILCDNVDDDVNGEDDENNHSYVYLQQQQHYTPPPLPPPLEFQEPPLTSPMQQQHQSLIKKGSIMRNNPELMKRNRQANSSYELSQDLLDKQIELLERKYGGVKARKAAIIIQRAFRHYKMVKKFNAITAMAKADKRISNRCSLQSLSSISTASTVQMQDVDQSDIGGGSTQASQKVCAIISATPPGQQRSTSTGRQGVSFRERRNVLDQSYSVPNSTSNLNNNIIGSGGGVVRRQSPHHHHHHHHHHYQQQQQQQQINQSPSQQQQSHAYVNLLHQQDQQYYNNYQNYQHNHNIVNNNSHYYEAGQPQQSQLNTSGSSTLSNNSSMNMSWNNSYGSPNVSAYSSQQQQQQQQLYIRPRTSSASKRVPPEVPKRTSSINQPPPKYQQSHMQHQHKHHHHHQTPPQQQPQHQVQYVIPPVHPVQQMRYKVSAENGVLHSIQSSPSSSTDSSGISSNSSLQGTTSQSPWKHSDQVLIDPQQLLQQQYILEKQQLLVKQQQQQTEQLQLHTKISETIRKRQYRIGLNLFNKKPEKGVTYLIHKGFLENSPHAVAKFLISRKGLSRQMIGEYLGNLQQPFNMAVLAYFADEMDFSKMAVDVALRKFQGYFRMPGEAQKIERLMEIFSQRYCDCNPDVVSKLRSSDTIFVLAFAIIMLNTDLHTPNIKADRRMKCEDFIKNLRGIDDCMDIDRNMLEGIYNRVKESEFKTASDHVTQVMKVQKTIVGKKLNLALPHRRLVCYCRLYEIPDINKKERSGLHQREVFLFNDLLVVTKIFTKKKTSVTYTFRNSYSLCGLVVTLLDVPNYPYCIRLSQKVDGKVLATFNARNEHDRCKFADDLRESITEMDEMESLRIEMELERQLKATRCVGNVINNNMDNRDSGVGDMEIQFSTSKSYETKSSSSNDLQNGQLKRGGALSNSLLDIHEQFGNEVRRERRGSVGSLDSGMSISFQSTSTNTTGSSVTNGKVEPTNGVFVNSVVAMAVAAGKSTVVSSRAQHQMQQQISSGQHLLQNAAGQIIMQAVPPLLPNSALYQYNTEQNMLHLQDIYEDHHVSSSGSSSSITKTAAGPRSTDV